MTRVDHPREGAGGPNRRGRAGRGKWAPHMAVILGVAIAITFLLLPVNVYPGLPSELAFLALISSPFWLPLVCISLWAYANMYRQAPELLGPRPGRRRWFATAALVLVLNCFLLWCGAPRWLAFLHARPAFQASLATPPPAHAGGERFDRRLGMYYVDRFARDLRGGIYFRTRFSPDGFYTHRMTYGFCHQPNREGSPFGDGKYVLVHVVGDWYAFQASEL